MTGKVFCRFRFSKFKFKNIKQGYGNLRDCKQQMEQIQDMADQFHVFDFQLSIVAECLLDHFGMPTTFHMKHSLIERTM